MAKITHTEQQKENIHKRYETMLGNLNAEKYTLDAAIELYQKAIDMTNLTEERLTDKGNKATGYKYDFIGEIARELNTYKDIFNKLLKKFPQELQALDNQLHTNIESNCFSNSKKNLIKEATALVNLKSNYRWTDRTQIDISAEKKNISDLFPDVSEDQ